MTAWQQEEGARKREPLAAHDPAANPGAPATAPPDPPLPASLRLRPCNSGASTGLPTSPPPPHLRERLQVDLGLLGGARARAAPPLAPRLLLRRRLGNLLVPLLHGADLRGRRGVQMPAAAAAARFQTLLLAGSGMRALDPTACCRRQQDPRACCRCQQVTIRGRLPMPTGPQGMLPTSTGHQPRHAAARAVESGSGGGGSGGGGSRPCISPPTCSAAGPGWVHIWGRCRPSPRTDEQPRTLTARPPAR